MMRMRVTAMLGSDDILTEIAKGNIVIKPFDDTKLNPNSYNLTLANEILVYTEDILDCKKNNPTKKIKLTDEGYVLSPGRLYLGSSIEYTETKQHIPHISGRASVGRVGLTAHISSGIGSVGYQGHWTFSITCIRPIRIYPKMRIAQIYFFPVIGHCSQKYAGKDVNDNKINTSKLYLEFEENQIN